MIDACVSVLVCARNEAAILAQTLAALQTAFPGARVVVADDCSEDQTAELARSAGCEVITTPRRLGKGGAATLAAGRLLQTQLSGVVVFCDADLGRSAAALPRLAERVAWGGFDLCVAGFSNPRGGGFSIALRFARRCVRILCGFEAAFPISGQRALRADRLGVVLPFAHGFGMEIGMTVDARRAGLSVCEIELDLSHRDTGRDLAGFVHRGRQLVDFGRVFLRRL